jgi:AcrR family transcriptional regulator
MSGMNTRSRGRPRLFDEEAVLDELTALFWRKGYSQTSMADLVDASGVHKSSLYSTFGTKEELFAKILRRYLAGRMDMLSALIERAGPGIDGIHNFLELLRGDVVSGTSQEGCLLVNTSAELHGTAPGFEDFGVEYRQALRERVRGLISQAEPEETTGDSLTDQRTDLFITFLFGLNVATRGGADESEIGRLIDAMHATVDTWRH